MLKTFIHTLYKTKKIEIEYYYLESSESMDPIDEKTYFDQNIFVKVRSTGNLLEAKLKFGENNLAVVDLINYEDGIAPGQACVFYNKDMYGHRVLGGGWIKE